MAEFNLMKFLRKNNRKIMAIVVVLIMFAFIMPQVISQWSNPGIKGSTAVAHFGIDSTISTDAINNARAELGILRTLQSAELLRSRPSLMNQQSPDVPSVLLSELLFPDPRFAPLVAEEVKRAAQQGSLRVTESQVNNFFEQLSSEKPEVYWILLKAEARKAGFVVSNEESGAILKSVVPQLTQNKASAEQIITQMVQQQAIEQNAILGTFGDLIAVMKFMSAVTQNENVTTDQIKYNVTQMMQTLDANAVVINASAFTKKIAEPSQEQMQKQLASFKKYFAGESSATNPHGFGYKQPARVKLEYAMVSLADVAKLVPAPTSEQVEEYYQRNLSQFKESVPSDANDPNSEKVDKNKPFSEVAGQIEQQLMQSRISDRAESIVAQVRDIAEANLAEVDTEKLSKAELKKLTSDYSQAAKEVSKKYNLPVYTAVTGPVAMEDMERSGMLARLFVPSQGRTPTRLGQIVFAVGGIDVTKLGPFDVAKPRYFESIGPLKDYMQQVAAIVRVVDGYKAVEPNSLDMTIAKKLPMMEGEKITESNDTFVLSKVVADDIKRLEAFEIALKAADALKAGAEKTGWDTAIAAINKEFAAMSDSNEGFKEQGLNGVKRVSEQDIAMARRQAQDQPARASDANMYENYKLFMDRMFMLASEKKQLPQVLVNQADMSVYVIRSMKLNPVSKEQYEEVKARAAFIENYVQSQSLGLDYLMPQNIMKRNNFRWDEKNRGKSVAPDAMPQDE